jgi:hypothetical protein
MPALPTTKERMLSVVDIAVVVTDAGINRVCVAAV